MIDELTPEIFDSILAVNVRAIYLTCRAAWSALKASSGVIVNISSIASQDAFSGFAAYGASKSWVNSWTRGLAEEGRPHRIRVFSIAPGGVETGMLRGAFPDYPKESTLEPSEVADMVHAVAQPACRYATGQTIFIQRRGD
jgi:NAD(P)-dependent dehydrogenase (short-subunit alcohol dehydrogenase family)